VPHKPRRPGQGRVLYGCCSRGGRQAVRDGAGTARLSGSTQCGGHPCGRCGRGPAWHRAWQALPMGPYQPVNQLANQIIINAPRQSISTLHKGISTPLASISTTSRSLPPPVAGKHSGRHAVPCCAVLCRAQWGQHVFCTMIACSGHLSAANFW